MIGPARSTDGTVTESLSRADDAIRSHFPPASLVAVVVSQKTTTSLSDQAFDVHLHVREGATGGLHHLPESRPRACYTDDGHAADGRLERPGLVRVQAPRTSPWSMTPTFIMTQVLTGVIGGFMFYWRGADADLRGRVVCRGTLSRN
jgi:hypothetical protein